MGKDEPSASGRMPARPGEALRALRRRRGWTLAQAAERTGLPVSTLSKVETGKMSLTYDKLARISEGLEVDIAQLFSPETAAFTGPAPAAPVTGRRSITLAGEGRAIETASYSHLYPAADLLNKRFVPIVAEVRARSLAEFGELIRHPGEEFAYVLEGAIELHTDLYAPVRLETGDSIYFDSGMGHAYLAAAGGRCRVLSICSASEHQLERLDAPAAPKPAAAQPQGSGTRGKKSRSRRLR